MAGSRSRLGPRVAPSCAPSARRARGPAAADGRGWRHRHRCRGRRRRPGRRCACPGRVPPECPCTPCRGTGRPGGPRARRSCSGSEIGSRARSTQGERRRPVPGGGGRSAHRGPNRPPRARRSEVVPWTPPWGSRLTAEPRRASSPGVPATSGAPAGRGSRRASHCAPRPGFAGSGTRQDASHPPATRRASAPSP